MHNKKYLILIATLALSLLGTAAMAGALKDRIIQRKPAIEALLAQGTIGENNLGLLEYRGEEANLEVVKAENADRITVYKAIAKKTGTTMNVVGARRAAKIAQKAHPGTWLQDGNGKWYRK